MDLVTGSVGIAAQTEGDRQFETLVRERFERTIDQFPTFATWLGIHDHDARLGDVSREAKLRQIAEEHEFLAALHALDPATLSEPFRFERELAINASERAIFDDEVHRVWERRASASDDDRRRPVPAVRARLRAAARAPRIHRRHGSRRRRAYFVRDAHESVTHPFACGTRWSSSRRRRCRRSSTRSSRRHDRSSRQAPRSCGASRPPPTQRRQPSTTTRAG